MVYGKNENLWSDGVVKANVFLVYHIKCDEKLVSWNSHNYLQEYFTPLVSTATGEFIGPTAGICVE